MTNKKKVAPFRRAFFIQPLGLAAAQFMEALASTEIETGEMDEKTTAKAAEKCGFTVIWLDGVDPIVVSPDQRPQQNGKLMKKSKLLSSKQIKYPK